MDRRLFASLPSVDRLVRAPELAGAPHDLVVEQARLELQAQRDRIRAGEHPQPALAARVAARVDAALARRHRRVINATGVVLHTNLGRAPLAPAAVAAVHDVARGYSNAELELDSGKRGGRLRGVSDHLCALTGAEAAIAVNNNAAAVLLVLTALAKGREVVLSRGELVEIGGSFRVPDVISAGGATLREVGTTNRTRAADYADAVSDHTAMLLRVHPSNFQLVGFCERPDRRELAAVARDAGVPLVEDLGSGLLGPPPATLAGAGLEGERVDRALAEGVDLACFSGDKLLGGPQAGLIVGRASLVAHLRRHPLYRALRMDKLGLAALEATLGLYRAGRGDAVPARALLAADLGALRRRAEALAARVPGARLRDDVGYSGGGALPGRGLPGVVVCLPSRLGSAAALSRRLRLGSPSVVARISDGHVIIDPRTLLPGEDAEVVERILECEPGLAAETSGG
jgi:L-seryl-tRNA(Ser) seleniumtransferase